MAIDLNGINKNNLNNLEEKRRFIRLEYSIESTKPYVMAFELLDNKLPSKVDILFSGTIKDISVNGLRITSREIEDYKNYIGKRVLFFITFQNTNFQRWVQGKVLYGKGNELSVTLSKTNQNNIYFADGTSCKTYNLIPIEILSREQQCIENCINDSTWLTESCKKNINVIFEKKYTKSNQIIFNSSLFSIINGVIQTYFFNLTDMLKENMNLENFLRKYKVEFTNKLDYAVTFLLDSMREEHIFIPNNYGNIGKLFINELYCDNFGYLFKRRWEGNDLLNKELVNDSKKLGEFLFENGLKTYYKNSNSLFPNPNMRAAGDAYVEQLSMFMEGRQKEIIEMFEFSANDLNDF